MSVAATDLVYYGCADMPEDNVGAMGGAIDLETRVIPDSASLMNTLNDSVEILSSNAGDTSQDVVITGRDAGGSIVTETLNLNGTTPVAGSQVFERIMKIEIAAAHAGTVTVRKATGDTAIVAIETGVLNIRVPFYDIAADASGGSTRIFYEKIFLKNKHGTLSFLGCMISENADTETQFEFAVEDAVDDNGGATNRITAPTGITGAGFSSSAKSIPGTDLAAGVAIGIFLKVTLPAGDPATKAVYELKAAGTSI